ncbi:MAG: HAD family hydrolase [Hasllibacter sp.]
MAIRGLLFDKDGTLFGFQETWGAWAADLARELAAGDAGRLEAIGAAMRLDLGTARFAPDSPVIAGTIAEQVALLLPLLPDWTGPRLEAHLARRAASAVPRPAAELPALMAALRGRGLALGVATNDGEAPARRHLEIAGIADAFEWIAGYDSGHGAKPAPGQLLGFLSATGLGADEVAMIGDTTHDLHAAAAIGMPAVAVLTGPAPAAELAPHAEVVLPDISYLPDWLDRRGGPAR